MVSTGSSLLAGNNLRAYKVIFCTHTQEGQQLLDGEQLEKTRAQTAAAKEEQEQESPAKIKRATTIAQTTQVSSLVYVIHFSLFSDVRPPLGWLLLIILWNSNVDWNGSPL